MHSRESLRAARAFIASAVERRGASRKLTVELFQQRRHAIEPWLVELSGRDVALLSGSDSGNRSRSFVKALRDESSDSDQLDSAALNVPEEKRGGEAGSKQEGEDCDSDCALPHAANRITEVAALANGITSLCAGPWSKTRRNTPRRRGSVVHVGELQAGLQFQLLTVEEIVRTEIDLVVLVASTSDDAIFVRRELNAVRVVAAENRVPADRLKLVGDVDVGHRRDPPESLWPR